MIHGRPPVLDSHCYQPTAVPLRRGGASHLAACHPTRQGATRQRLSAYRIRRAAACIAAARRASRPGDGRRRVSTEDMDPVVHGCGFGHAELLAGKSPVVARYIAQRRRPRLPARQCSRRWNFSISFGELPWPGPGAAPYPSLDSAARAGVDDGDRRVRDLRPAYVRAMPTMSKPIPVYPSLLHRVARECDLRPLHRRSQDFDQGVAHDGGFDHHRAG